MWVPKCIQYDHTNTVGAFLHPGIAFQKLTTDIDPVTPEAPSGTSEDQNSLQTHVTLDFILYLAFLRVFSFYLAFRSILVSPNETTMLHSLMDSTPMHHRGFKARKLLDLRWPKG